MIKTGQAWAGTFVTLDSTGALAAGTPSGVLYIDGTANGAAVTISGSNPYKWSVTLPSLTAGQRVDMYITATIATIATAGIVASEQADTAILSDGVVVASLATDSITAAALKADAVTEIQNGLATAAALDTVDNFLDTEIAAILADTNELQTDLVNGGRLDLLIDAIKAKTDTIAAAPTAASVADAVWDEAISGHTTSTTFGGKNQKVVPSETVGDYKADVSGLATSTALTAVSGLVDDLETRLTAARAGYLDNLNTGVALTAAGVDAILDEAVVGSYTLRQLLKVMAAALAGKATGGGTTSVTFRGVDDASNVIVATVDSNGNRSAVTLTV